MNKISERAKRVKSTLSHITFFFTVIILFNSCSVEPTDELNKLIKIALRNDNRIDKTEWDEFVAYSQENKQEFFELFNDEGEINTEELSDLIYKIANKRRNKEKPEIYKQENSIEEDTQVNVFIENSGSMDGYVKGTTEFEAALSDLLVQIQYKYNKEKNNNENLKINFINTKIYPSKVDEVNSFVEALEPRKAPYEVGNRSVSKLNEILEIILDSTKKDEISILTSDCIYSLDKGKDTEGALEFQKSLTKGAFLEKSKEFDFSTIILKMNSKFDGRYWDKNNQETYLSKEYRPYYIWVIGRNPLIEKFQENIDLSKLKGFENSYFLSNVNSKSFPYHTILSETNRKGGFRKSNRKAKSHELRDIESIEYDNGIFQFSIAIDLDHVQADNSYLIDKENYKVTEGYVVESIKSIDIEGVEKRDYNTISKTTATHIVTISLSSDFRVQDLELELSNKVPSWVVNSNSMDDSDVINELNKTFGLHYLVEGVYEAYIKQNSDNRSYFKINIPIKK